MKKIKELLGYIGLFFMLSAPFIVCFSAAIITGETTALLDPQAAHSGIPKQTISPYVFAGILGEVFWLMAAVLLLFPSDVHKDTSRCLTHKPTTVEGELT